MTPQGDSVSTEKIEFQRKPGWCSAWRKYTRTCTLVFAWICLGLYSEILGPTLPTLMHQTGSNYKQIGSALAIRSAGLLSGSLLGGFTSDRFAKFRAFQMCLALMLAALTNFVIPWIRSLSGLSFLFYLAGCTHGFLTTNGNPLLASIWEAQASGPFSLMHAGYGIGGAVAPALVAPFTKVLSGSSGENHSMVLVTLPIFGNNATDPVIVDATPPYSIVGITLGICSLCFLTYNRRNLTVCCFYQRSRPDEKSKNSVCSKQDAEGAIPHSPRDSARTICQRVVQHTHEIKRRTTRSTILIFLGVFVIYFAIVGNERVFGKFMFTYAIASSIRMSTDKGYLLNLLYWLFFGLARVITCLLSLLVPAQLLMFIVVVGTLLTSFGLIVIPLTERCFFLMTCLFSMFKSPLFPTTLAAINRSYEITGCLVLMVNLGSAVGASSMQYAAGSLIQTFGQFVFPFIVFGSACVVLFTASLLLILLRKIGERFNADDNQIPVEKADADGMKSETVPLET